MIDPAQCTAVVLAGGRSRRMGRDKASLPHPAGGSFLHHQLELLKAISFAQVWVSARPAQTLPDLPPDVRVVTDDGAAGPLGGIVAALRANRPPWLLVLAVDLPLLTAETIRTLLTIAGPTGVVPQTANGVEPLAAIYPIAWLPVAEAALTTERFGLRTLLEHPDSAPYFAFVSWPDAAPFANCNRPEDLPAP